MTLDCNLQAQGITIHLNGEFDDYTRFMTLGIQLFGSHIRVRRVRFINWGTQTPQIEFQPNKNPSGPPTDYQECMVCFLGSSTFPVG
jgi:hypothetical protein